MNGSSSCKEQKVWSKPEKFTYPGVTVGENKKVYYHIIFVFFASFSPTRIIILVILPTKETTLSDYILGSKKKKLDIHTKQIYST